MRLRTTVAVLAASSVLLACSDSNNSNNTANGGDVGNSTSYSAEITRTEYGIPHVVAQDWGGLGYGHGYVFAQDNYCALMQSIVRANGVTLEEFGESQGDEQRDFIYSLLNDNSEGQLEEEYLTLQPEYVLQLVEGYAAGFNRFLDETGVENLAEGEPNCRNASWVREITAIDLWKYFRLIQLQGSTDQGIVRQAIMDATGPGPASPAAAVTAVVDEMDAELENPDTGSNGIALGRDATQTGTGMLLGNPHQPWQGVGAFYQVHLTIPGEYDAMGAALQGFPKIAIGFNKDLAWTHTVSVANRFSLFELKLNPDDPLQYEVDGEFKDITPETVTIQVTREDGSVETREHTFYHWEYGLIVNLKSAAASVSPALGALFDGWPTPSGSVYALRDANLNNLRGIEMWTKIGQAENIPALIEALKLIGNPLFHTLAADRTGDTFYGEISAIPNIDQAKLEDCVTGINQAVLQLTNEAIVALDGSRSECQWGVDADAPEGSGLFGYESLPKIIGAPYVANSNDSYWLSNPSQPLEGFPSTMGFAGHEGKQQNLRTQINHAMVAGRLEGTDGLDPSPLFTLASLQQLTYENRVFAAELTLDDVLSICDSSENAVTDDGDRAFEACALLAQWDRRAEVDSIGTQVFTEFWKVLESANGPFNSALVSDELWRIDFDPSQPLTTPSGIDTEIPANRERIIIALSEAVSALDAAGVPLDAPWREVQVFPRNAVDIPIHGGRGSMGVFGAISSNLVEGGYRNIRAGNSYIQTVTWDESECPIAQGVITHSQSIDPASDFYSDQSELYAMKRWVNFPFCSGDIQAAAIAETYTLSTDD